MWRATSYFALRATVFDARLLPTSKAQCKHGGWRNYPQFKNQGDCVRFVNNGKERSEEKRQEDGLTGALA
jgi:hypothetical protein